MLESRSIVAQRPVYLSRLLVSRKSQIRVVGELAYEVGSEVGELIATGQPVSFEHRVTTVYRRQGEGWKMVHHHTDINPAEQERYRQGHSSQARASS